MAHWVRVREEAGGGLPAGARRLASVMVEPFAGKIEELVDRSHAHVRADAVHGVLVGMGYEGSERTTTRRAVAAFKRRWRQKHGRRTRSWIPQPGLWMQPDWAGEGPVVAGVQAMLFCVACVVAVSGGGAVARQDDELGGDRAGPHAAPDRRGSHVRSDG